MAKLIASHYCLEPEMLVKDRRMGTLIRVPGKSGFRGGGSQGLQHVGDCEDGGVMVAVMGKGLYIG